MRESRISSRAIDAVKKIAALVTKAMLVHAPIPTAWRRALAIGPAGQVEDDRRGRCEGDGGEMR